MTGVLLLLVAAAADPATAPPAATWRVVGRPGEVTAVVGEVRTGGRIIGDMMVSDPRLVGDERGIFAKSPAKPGSCGWANAVRPFTRLRRFARDGRLLWEWHVDRVQQALRLHSGDGDCLSPDGGRLTVRSYRYDPMNGEPVAALGESVIAVDHKPRFVDATGVRTHQQFGDGHNTYILGWQRGHPAMLLFAVGDENDPMDETKVKTDYVVMSEPKKH